MLKPVRNPSALLARMVKEIGEIGAGIRVPVRPISLADGEMFSVRMVAENHDNDAMMPSGDPGFFACEFTRDRVLYR